MNLNAPIMIIVIINSKLHVDLLVHMKLLPNMLLDINVQSLASDVSRPLSTLRCCQEALSVT